jgi:hypothetical protein
LPFAGGVFVADEQAPLASNVSDVWAAAAA